MPIFETYIHFENYAYFGYFMLISCLTSRNAPKNFETHMQKTDNPLYFYPLSLSSLLQSVVKILTLK